MKFTSPIAFVAAALLAPGTLAAAVLVDGTISTNSTVADNTTVSSNSAFLRPRSELDDQCCDMCTRCNEKFGRYCDEVQVTELDPIQDNKDGLVMPPCKPYAVLWAHWDPCRERNDWHFDNNFDNFGGLFVDEIAFVTGFKHLAVQGVKFHNDVSWREKELLDKDNRPSIDQGAMNIEWTLNRTAHFCPKTKFILAGEYLGARIVHVAVNRPDSVAASDRVAASCPLGSMSKKGASFALRRLGYTKNLPH
ncbi:hypothetical protein MBLNU457_g0503t2 [Dothideomycetes sp. NU457]